jgi:menaquinone-dependent protoporphyrinogen oxidase
MGTTHTTPRTPQVPVFYASTEGQTHLIADRLVAVLRAEGVISTAVDVSAPDSATVDWPATSGAFVGASLHAGRHQAAMTTFVRRHVRALNERPTIFYSVSLSAASANASERQTAQRLAEAFPPALGWTPRRVVSLAGRLAYSKYGFFKRMVLKRIARKEGAPTDTSRDYEFTDWTAVETLAREMAELVRTSERRKAGAA